MENRKSHNHHIVYVELMDNGNVLVKVKATYTLPNGATPGLRDVIHKNDVSKYEVGKRAYIMAAIIQEKYKDERLDPARISYEAASIWNRLTNGSKIITQI